MIRVLCCMVLVGLTACAGTNVTTKGGVTTAEQRDVERLEKKNSLLLLKMVRMAFDKAQGQEAQASSVVDFSLRATSVTSSALEKVAQRLVARVNPKAGECDTAPGALVVKNETGQHMILLVDELPTAVVYGSAVTDYIGPGVSVHLCLPHRHDAHVLVGGTFADLQAGTKVSSVFYLEQDFKSDEVNTLSITSEMLSSR